MSWKDLFLQKIGNYIDPTKSRRIAIIGVGNPLRGDDGVGCSIAHLLLKDFRLLDHILVLDAESSPENITGVVRRFAPDLIIIIDAAQMDKEPGEIMVLDLESISGCGISSHSFPLTLFAAFIQDEIKCDFVIVGIQPLSVSFGGEISVPVRQSIEDLRMELVKNLQIEDQSPDHSHKIWSTSHLWILSNENLWRTDNA